MPGVGDTRFEFKTYKRLGGFLWPNQGKKRRKPERRFMEADDYYRQRCAEVLESPPRQRVIVHRSETGARHTALPGDLITWEPVFSGIAIRTGMVVAVRSPGTMQEEVDVVWNPWREVEGFIGHPSDRRFSATRDKVVVR